MSLIDTRENPSVLYIETDTIEYTKPTKEQSGKLESLQKVPNKVNYNAMLRINIETEYFQKTDVIEISQFDYKLIYNNKLYKSGSISGTNYILLDINKFHQYFLIIKAGDTELYQTILPSENKDTFENKDTSEIKTDIYIEPVIKPYNCPVEENELEHTGLINISYDSGTGIRNLKYFNEKIDPNYKIDKYDTSDIPNEIIGNLNDTKIFNNNIKITEKNAFVETSDTPFSNDEFKKLLKKKQSEISKMIDTIDSGVPDFYSNSFLEKQKKYLNSDFATLRKLQKHTF